MEEPWVRVVQFVIWVIWFVASSQHNSQIVSCDDAALTAPLALVTEKFLTGYFVKTPKANI
jgi:hypothetical protein